MKKIICTILALMMIFALCACGESEIEPTEVATELETEREVTFSLGETDADTYTNEFIGLGYKKAPDWIFYSDEEIMALNNVALDMASEDVNKLIENADILYAMEASDESMLNNININLEKLGAEEVEALDIVSNYELAIPELEKAFAEMGCTGFTTEHKKVYIDGEEFDALKSEIEIEGFKMYQVIFQKKCGEYLANVTITASLEDTTDSLIENFFIV